MKRILLFAFLVTLTVGFNSKKNKFPKNFVFIPAQKVDSYGEPFAVNAFFMAKNEVTNAEYRSFLSDLKANKLDSLYSIACPDTLAWNKIGGYMSPMVEYYFSHPAYDNYPVVNISKQGAELYCQWLTKKLQATYGDQLKKVRIPTKHEWIVSATGGLEKSIYPWGGPYLRGSKGNYLANFRVVGDENIQMTKGELKIVNDSTHSPVGIFADSANITTPVDSYNPNGYGLYNMSGNVAELTSEQKAMGGHWYSTGYDIRITSEIDFEKANPFVGFRPIFTYVFE